MAKHMGEDMKVINNESSTYASRAMNYEKDDSPHLAITVPSGTRYGPSHDGEMAQLAATAHTLSTYFPEDSVICEIGSLVGKSAIAMASVASHHIIAIDPHDHFENRLTGVGEGEIGMERIGGSTLEPMKKNLKYYGVEDKVTIVHDYSYNVAKDWNFGRICLLFVDGNHDYEDVRQDVELFVPFIHPGGVIAFHDYGLDSYPGVKQAVDEFSEEGLVKPYSQFGCLVFCVLN